jgi:hypothetical protein
MLSGLMMITRRAFTGLHGRLIGLVSLLAVAAVTATCDSVPLLAPSGSFITLTASTNAIAATGTAELIAQLLEPSGTPPHPGTQVIFTTTLGVVEPATVTTDINGRALATFRGNGVNGVATINAASGGATTASASGGTTNGGTTTPSNGTGPVRIFVGAAAVGRVTVNATPATIPSGGTSTIAASVFDVNGSALAGTAVSFSTDAGTLAASVVTTNNDGVATTSLTTSQSATITASVGASGSSGGGGGGGGNGTTTPTGQSSGQAKVTVVPNTTVTITPPSNPPSAGLPAVFTFVVTIPTGGNPVRELRVNWGDGDSQNLGAVSGSQAASHVYEAAGSYVVTATLVDVAGISQTVSSSVTVIPVPRPGVVVTPTPQSIAAGGTISFRIDITAPPGIGIINTTINFGDNTSQSLGGASSVTVTHQYGPPLGQKLVTVTVEDTAGQRTEGTTTVSVTN